MLKFHLLKPESNDRCDECGRQWFEVHTGYDGPDVRPYARVLGCIGETTFRAVLCPACLDELAGVLYDAGDHKHIFRANRQHEREELVDALLARLPIPIDWSQETENAQSVIRHFQQKGVA